MFTENKKSEKIYSLFNTKSQEAQRGIALRHIRFFIQLVKGAAFNIH